MKKNILAIMSILTIFVAGCSNTQTSNKKTEKSSETKTEKVASVDNYEKLSESMKKNVSFRFSQNNESTDAIKNIDVTITNSSSRDVKFNLAKFIISGFTDNALFKSNKTGTLIVKAGKTAKVENIFKEVPAKRFTDKGYFLYIDKSNELAFVNMKDKTFADSENLEDAELINNQADKKGNNQADSNKNDTKDKIILNQTMASALVAHAYATMMDIYNVNEVQDGYEVTRSDMPDFKILVKWNGDLEQDGHTTPFKEVSGPTEKEPDFDINSFK